MGSPERPPPPTKKERDLHFHRLDYGGAPTIKNYADIYVRFAEVFPIYEGVGSVVYAAPHLKGKQ